MIYLWAIPENFKDCDIGSYDYDNSPDRFVLLDGRNIEPSEFTSIATVNFEVQKKRVLNFDCLPNSGNCPLVNKRVKKILENLAPNDIQFFPVKCVCSDGELDSYYYVNITHLFAGIDHEKSIYTKMKTVDAIAGFKYLTYKPGCLGTYHLARDREYSVNLLVSEAVKLLFDKERVTGVWLAKPEEFYRPLSELL